ncbi:MAG TPA: dTDP-glucose 4,6-dehydratase [Bryobacteraceae bacterium]|nr:dTDP-glucose 4,6-dehydratase [Bryobacteraceae bacterium]
MQLFVTGGAGFIGSEFIRQSIAAGHTIINFDKLTYAGNLDNLAPVVDNPRYSLVVGDVCDAAAAAEAVPENCDAIVHFAAESHVDRSILSAEEFVLTNVLGTQIMLDVARHRKVKRFLHISTDEVGGDMEPDGWYREDSPMVPSSPYAASKTAAEHFVRAATRTFGLDTIVTRTSNNYGPYQFPEKLLPLAISNAIDDKPIPVYGDGLQVRDWVHVADNCKALTAVLERGRIGETYHIGGGDPMTNLDVLRTLLRVLDKPESLLTTVKDRPGHDRRYAVHFGKITAELGWNPEIRFEAGLASTIAWYQANAEWVRRCKSGEYKNYYETMYRDREVNASRPA